MKSLKCKTLGAYQRRSDTRFNFHVTIMRNVECNYQPGELCSDASTFLAKSLLESLLLD